MLVVPVPVIEYALAEKAAMASVPASLRVKFKVSLRGRVKGTFWLINELFEKIGYASRFCQAESSARIGPSLARAGRVRRGVEAEDLKLHVVLGIFNQAERDSDLGQTVGAVHNLEGNGVCAFGVIRVGA